MFVDIEEYYLALKYEFSWYLILIWVNSPRNSKMIKIRMKSNKSMCKWKISEPLKLFWKHN